jgi:hypothetical protein
MQCYTYFIETGGENMDKTITITIPTPWIEDMELSQQDLQEALKLGLAHLRHVRAAQQESAQVIQALCSTGKIQHLQAPPARTSDTPERQPPPTLPGTPVSEILIAQRRER